MLKRILGLGIIFISSILSGCSIFLPGADFPIIEKKSGNIHSVTTTSDRRSNFIDTTNNHYCAEPSPDSGVDLFGQLKTLGDLSFTEKGEVENKSGDGKEVSAKQEADAKVKLEYAKTVATVSKQIFKRTQGVQMFRDGLFHLCQAHHNNAISKSDYVKYYQVLMENAVLLTYTELYIQKASDESSDQESLSNLFDKIKELQEKIPTLNANTPVAQP